MWAIILVPVAGLLVWHFTRANQARLGVRARRTQIKNLWREIRKFALRGSVVLIVFVLLLLVAVRH